MSSLRHKLESSITRYWYAKPPVKKSDRLAGTLLAPLRALYEQATENRIHARHRPTSAHPTVIVIGNITVGGSGKTPLLIALAKVLIQRGFRVGIISRGYKARLSSKVPYLLSLDDSAVDVGDEARLIFDTFNSDLGDSLASDSLSSNQNARVQNRRNTTPIVICKNRVLALDRVKKEGVDIVLSDDGMQHYALARHIEIAVIDGGSGFGNGHLLPQGPLREPITRLNKVDHIVVSGEADSALIDQLNTFDVPIAQLNPTLASPLAMNARAASLPDSDILALTEKYQSIILVAGIGRPNKFFDAVRNLIGAVDTELVTYAFPDHHAYHAGDFEKIVERLANRNLDTHDAAILMTAKDAVKCRELAATISLPIFSVDLNIELSPDFVDSIAAQCTKQIY